MYNAMVKTEGGDPNWVNNVTGTIAGVRKRLPTWQGNLDSYE
jgi:hypothetical protein